MIRVSPLSAGACIVPGVFALVAWLLYFVPGLAGAYGAFIDEHYYVACANRLAWGYVDHPPLGLFNLRLAMTLAGDRLAVLRAVASTFGALTVFVTVCWRRGSVPEIVEDGVPGFVVDNEMAAISAVGRIGELDRRRVRAEFDRRFSAERMAKDYVRHYRALSADA